MPSHTEKERAKRLMLLKQESDNNLRVEYAQRRREALSSLDRVAEEAADVSREVSDHALR